MHGQARLIRERFVSRSLEGNPLGDPVERDLIMVLPSGYDERKRYPVVYILAGFTGTGGMLLNDAPWSPSLDRRFERLCGIGDAKPAILVLPDCFTRLGGSQYLNSEATGRYEDYVTGEIVPYVDANLRTIPRREARAVAGKSSGGYGALRLLMRRPDLFGAAASHSGDVYFEYCYLPDLPKLAAGLGKYDGRLEAFLAAFDAMPRKTDEAVAVMNMVAMAACYSPERSEPLGIALPIDTATGEMRADVWARWLEHDPVRMAARHEAALRDARLLYFDAGTRDEFHLQLGARIFAHRLQERGIAYTHEEFDDGHFQVSYRYDRSLALLTQVLECE